MLGWSGLTLLSVALMDTLSAHAQQLRICTAYLWYTNTGTCLCRSWAFSEGGARALVQHQNSLMAFFLTHECEWWARCLSSKTRTSSGQMLGNNIHNRPKKIMLTKKKTLGFFGRIHRKRDLNFLCRLMIKRKGKVGWKLCWTSPARIQARASSFMVTGRGLDPADR